MDLYNIIAGTKGDGDIVAQKDITEKTLESYNDVFADILNVLLFHGEQLVKPDELEDQRSRASFKADGKVHEIERDVAKRWIQNNVRIACIGLENQTAADPYMPLRVMGYDGVEYRTQLRDLKPGQKPSPVITLVLYFGYKGHWKAPLSLVEALKVPEILKPYVTDVKVNLFEIAYLSWEQVNLFRSDFKEIARYFVQMRENGDYHPSDDEMEHIEAVMQLLNVMDRDSRFQTAIDDRIEQKEVRKMSEWLTRVLNESESKGIEKGLEKGREEGLEKGREEGLEKGREEGLEKGAIQTLWSLVKDGLLTLEVASARAGLTEKEFQARATALMSESTSNYDQEKN